MSFVGRARTHIAIFALTVARNGDSSRRYQSPTKLAGGFAGFCRSAGFAWAQTRASGPPENDLIPNLRQHPRGHAKLEGTHLAEFSGVLDSNECN